MAIALKGLLVSFDSKAVQCLEVHKDRIRCTTKMGHMQTAMPSLLPKRKAA
jgi:hypothetical protein